MNSLQEDQQAVILLNQAAILFTKNFTSVAGKKRIQGKFWRLKNKESDMYN